jgi:hypothetical protein
MSKLHRNAYIRSGVSGWPIDKQEAALRAAGFNGVIYRDDHLFKSRRVKNVEALLKERTEMLRQTTSHRKAEVTIWVASYLCLAISPVDLTLVLGKAIAGNVTIRALDVDAKIGPGAGLTEISQAIQTFDQARRRQQTRAARTRGTEVAAERARRRSPPKLTKARELWGQPTETITTKAIAVKAGLSVKTLYKHLGKRTAAQRN